MRFVCVFSVFFSIFMRFFQCFFIFYAFLCVLYIPRYKKSIYRMFQDRNVVVVGFIVKHNRPLHEVQELKEDM